MKNTDMSNTNIDTSVSILQGNHYPVDFVPGNKFVLIGRGKQCFNHRGNEELRVIVEANVKAYSKANTKSKKSMILARIYQQVCKEGGFVKQDKENGLWHDVGESLAREKISQTFRNVLHSSYKSSSKSKNRCRQLEKKKSEQMQFEDMMGDDDDEGSFESKDRTHQVFSNSWGHKSGSNFADSALFDRLSSSLSSMIDEKDINPFEPVPMKEDSDNSLFKSSTTELEFEFEMEDDDMMTDDNFGDLQQGMLVTPAHQYEFREAPRSAMTQ